MKSPLPTDQESRWKTKKYPYDLRHRREAMLQRLLKPHNLQNVKCSTLSGPRAGYTQCRMTSPLNSGSLLRSRCAVNSRAGADPRHAHLPNTYATHIAADNRLRVVRSSSGAQRQMPQPSTSTTACRARWKWQIQRLTELRFHSEFGSQHAPTHARRMPRARRACAGTPTAQRWQEEDPGPWAWTWAQPSDPGATSRFKSNWRLPSARPRPQKVTAEHRPVRIRTNSAGARATDAGPASVYRSTMSGQLRDDPTARNTPAHTFASVSRNNPQVPTASRAPPPPQAPGPLRDQGIRGGRRTHNPGNSTSTVSRSMTPTALS